MSNDRDGRGDGRKLSYSERDRLRREGSDRSDRAPRGEKAQERAREATSNYLRRAEEALFSKSGGGSEEDRLTKALRIAHGTQDFGEACTEYRAALGMPADAGLLSLFLDSRAPDLIREALEALARLEAESLDVPALKSQLRILVYHQNGEIADLAEEILENL